MKRYLSLLIVMLLGLSFAQPSLSVSPQELMGSDISIDAITLEQDGFVVVHAYDMNDELVLTPPLGVTYLTAGMHENVVVTLDPMLLAEYGYDMTTKNVLPMLHVDANMNQTYEFPEGGDVPVMVNDAMVVADLALTVGGMDSMNDSSDMMSMEAVIGEGQFEVMLSGSQEVPAVMGDAMGSATVTLMGSSLSISGDFSGLSSPFTGAHLHMAAAGENGDVVFPLSVTVAADGMSGIFSGDFSLSEEQVNAFKAGHLYVNVHSEMNKGGEIRVQLLPHDMMMGMMDMTPALMVSPQMGSSIRLDSVTLAQDGFVVVHAYDMNDELVLTPPLGVVYLTAGTHENVMVELDPMLLSENGYDMTSKNVLPMLHIDANANMVYEFPDGGDVPVMLNDEMVVATLELTN
ncbi:MAG: CHRD domain-containing protein [Trueperaceae bacterium]|nr:CHRD domain-containing protein [Trueperaceae bacterium]